MLPALDDLADAEIHMGDVGKVRIQGRGILRLGGLLILLLLLLLLLLFGCGSLFVLLVRIFLDLFTLGCLLTLFNLSSCSTCCIFRRALLLLLSSAGSGVITTRGLFGLCILGGLSLGHLLELRLRGT